MESEDLLSIPEPETSEPVQQPEQEAPEPVQQEEKDPAKAGKKLSRLAIALLMFVIKLMIVALTVFVLFSYVFGVTRNQSLNMQPAVQDGDLLFYYRLVNDYAADDVVIVHHEEK
ncbi:MAG: S24/S26 family peptidase [Firmicutes bacterium]|nr:S24/S26 family peptidase [Bacillota bacterium]